LAPFLAPPIELPSLNPESAKGSLTGQSRLHTACRGHTERHRQVPNDCRSAPAGGRRRASSA
jgi:hypothetical protein